MTHTTLHNTILECMTSTTLRDIANTTGINITRLHRIRMGKTPDLAETFKLAKAFGIQIATGEEAQEIYRLREEMISSAIDQLEMKVSQKYGITLEMLRWTLSNQALKIKTV